MRRDDGSRDTRRISQEGQQKNREKVERENETRRKDFLAWWLNDVKIEPLPLREQYAIDVTAVHLSKLIAIISYHARQQQPRQPENKYNDETAEKMI